MDLTDYRKEIDAIDQQMVELFVRRMAVSQKIGAYKREKGLPILDAEREQEKLREIAEHSPTALQPYTASLYREIFALSRRCQEEKICSDAD